MRCAWRAGAKLLLLAAVLGGIGWPGGSAGPDARATVWSPGSPPAVATVFDTRVLHEIAITVEEKDLATLDRDRSRRVPCTFTFDGHAYVMVGIRRKGGINSLSPLSEKPAFSIKLNAFIKHQRLFGIDKLILNNARQDVAFLNEHLGYELYRRAHLPAPLTAHAVVTFNGEPRGVYVIKEAVDRQFLVRNFGVADAGGNLYEGSCPFDDPCTDFLEQPQRMELKRQGEERRNRDDLRALVKVVRETPEAEWVRAVRERLDLDGFLTGCAIDALANHWDSYSGNVNNYFMYDRSSDGRFVFIPHGMDSLFGVDGVYPDIEVRSPFAPPKGRLAEDVREAPALAGAYERAIQRVLREAWDERALMERIEQVGRTLHSTTRTDPRTQADLARFDGAVDRVRRFIVQRKAKWLTRGG